MKNIILPLTIISIILGNPNTGISSTWDSGSNGWTSNSSTWEAVTKLVINKRSSTNLETSILNVIGKAESPKNNYNAVVWSAKRKPPALPTHMTIGEIQSWVLNTPKQNHAIGRYQFIPETFNTLVKKLGFSKGRIFDANIQDAMAISLLESAKINDYRSGKISADRFMDNLAKIWAGLPLLNGKSAYENIANNKATVKRHTVRNALNINERDNHDLKTQKTTSKDGWKKINSAW